jgi:hypothetical protein
MSSGKNGFISLVAAATVRAATPNHAYSDASFLGTFPRLIEQPVEFFKRGSIEIFRIYTNVFAQKVT